MDPTRFDALTRSLAAPKTRRGLLGTIAALGAGLAARGAGPQVTQAQCGNKVCAANPGVCTNGCVCCVYGNGNSRCRPPGECGSGTVVSPTTTTTTQAPTTTTTTTAAPTTSTTTSTTTTPCPACGACFGPCPGSCECSIRGAVPGSSFVCITSINDGSRAHCGIPPCPSGEVCIGGNYCVTACTATA